MGRHQPFTRYTYGVMLTVRSLTRIVDHFSSISIPDNILFKAEPPDDEKTTIRNNMYASQATFNLFKVTFDDAYMQRQVEWTTLYKGALKFFMGPFMFIQLNHHKTSASLLSTPGN